jgi:hypothetical protein
MVLMGLVPMGLHPAIRFAKETRHAQDTDAALVQVTAFALMAGQEKTVRSVPQITTIRPARRNAPQHRTVQGTADAQDRLFVPALGSGMGQIVPRAPWDFTVAPVTCHALLCGFARVTVDAQSQGNVFAFMDGGEKTVHCAGKPISAQSAKVIVI